MDLIETTFFIITTFFKAGSYNIFFLICLFTRKLLGYYDQIRYVLICFDVCFVHVRKLL